MTLNKNSTCGRWSDGRNMIYTKYRHFLWRFVEDCPIVAILFHHRGTILFREGNLSTGDYSCFCCLWPWLEDWRALCPLISESTYPSPERDFLQTILENIFSDCAPRPKWCNPQIRAIRKVNGISTLSHSYQRGRWMINLREQNPVVRMKITCHSTSCARCYPRDTSNPAQRRVPFTPESDPDLSSSSSSPSPNIESRIVTCQAVG